MIFKQDTIKSWFTGANTSIDNEVVQPFRNAEQVIWKYNQAIQNNSLTQKGWERLLAQSDDGLKAYLTNIKGTTACMSGYNISLQGNVTGFKKVSSAITQYNTLSTSGIKEQSAFATAVSVTNGKLGNYLTGLNGTKASMNGYVKSLVSAKISTIGLQAASIALNTAMTMGISLAIQGIITGIDRFVHKAEKTKETTENFISSFKTLQNNFNENTKTLSGLQKEYDEVSKGVDSLGNNIGDTNEQYDIYKDIISQVSDMMPGLAVRYNEQGEKIGFVKGKLEDLNAEYDEYKKKQAKKIVTDGFDDDTTITDVFNNYNNYGKPSNKIFDLKKLDPAFKNNREKIKELQDEINAKSPQIDFFGFKFDASKIIGGELNNDSVEEKIAEMQKYQDEIDISVAGIQDALMVLSQANRKFWNLSEQQQNYVTTFFGNVTDEFIEENDLTNEVKARKFINKFINAISTNKDGINDAMNELFSFDFDTKDMNPDEIKEKVNEMIQNIADILGIKNVEQFKISLGFEFVNNDADEYDKILNKFKGKDKQRGKDVQSWADSLNVTPEELEKLEKDGYDATTSIESLTGAIQKYRKEASVSNPKTFSQIWNAIGTTGTDEQKKAAQETKEEMLELAKAGKLTEEKLKDSSIADEFKKAGMSIDEATRKINKFAEASDQLASMKAGISAISEVLGQKKENLADKKTRSEGIGADTLAGFDAEIKGLDSWDEFEKTLGNGESRMKDCQKAANKLATEWVNSNNFLANLTGTKKRYYISTLKEMGVKNAEVVVTQALAQKEAELNAEKQWTSATTKSLTEATASEITQLSKEHGWAQEVTDSLYRLALQKQTANGIKLSTQADIEQLMGLVDAIGGTTSALEAWKNYSGGGGTLTAKKKWLAAKKEVQNALKKSKKKVTADVDVVVTPSSTSSKNKDKKKDKTKKQKESKQEIDWIDRRLTSISNKLNLIKAAYENIASAVKGANLDKVVSKQNSNLDRQYKLLKRLEKSSIRSASKYAKKASSVKISKNKKTDKKLKSMVRSEAAIGKKTSYKTLIKKYGQKTADRITKYRDYYDKSISSKQSAKEYRKQQTEARIQKHQNLADKYQSYIDKQAARKEVDNTKNLGDKDLKLQNSASKKAKNIKEQIKYTNKLYEQQKKIAELEGNSQEVARLEAERRKTIIELQVESLQNYADENEASYNLKATQASMATNYKEKNRLGKEGIPYLKSQYDYLIKIAKKEGNITEEKRLQLEKTQKINEETKNSILNVGEDYENRLIGNNRQMQVWNNAASLAEAKGKTVSGKFYGQMAEVAEQEKAKRKEELAVAWGTYEDNMRDNPNFINSNEWYEAIKNINDISDAFEQAGISAEKYKQQVIEADWAIADSAQQAIDYLNDEAETYKTIFGYKDMYDKNGALTEAGTATFALDVYGIENSISKIKEYNDEVDRLNELYGKGDISQEAYDKRMQELREGVLESTETIYSLRDALKSLIEEGLNAELDALNEMIDKVKDNLSEASSLRDYQKNIEKQTKNISSLERQLSARSGDMSEKGRADVEKLKVQLEEAKSDLEDTEYDKYIEDQERILDDMSDDFQKYLDAQLDQIDGLLNGIIENVRNGKTDISEAIRKVGETIGADLSKVLSENLSGFASTGVSNASGVYDNTKENYENSANEEFNQGASTPVMNTDENKGTIQDNGKASDPAYQKTSAWLKSKGFSDNDVNRMYDSLGNAQSVFTGMQNIGGNPSAIDIFHAYQNQDADKSKGFSTFEQTDAYKNEQNNIRQRKQQNNNNMNQIESIFATVRPYEDSEEYQTGTISKYGSQKFAQENGIGYNKYLSMENVKKVDNLVKGLVNLKTGKPLYNTSKGSYIYAAIKDLDDKNGNAFKKAITGRASYGKSTWNVGGFSKGGIVDTSTLSKIAEKNGDDAWVTVKSGEGILNPMDTENLVSLTDFLKNCNVPDVLDSRNIVPNNVNASNNMYGNVSIHLDGSNIKDVDTFVDWYDNAVKHSKKMRDANASLISSFLTNDNMAYKRI